MTTLLQQQECHVDRLVIAYPDVKLLSSVSLSRRATLHFSTASTVSAGITLESGHFHLFM